MSYKFIDYWKLFINLMDCDLSERDFYGKTSGVFQGVQKESGRSNWKGSDRVADQQSRFFSKCWH